MHAPAIPSPPLPSQYLADPVRIVRPLAHGQLHAAHGLGLLPGPSGTESAVAHPGRVDAHEADAIQREPDRRAVAVDQAAALERVADDGQALRPGGVAAPELDEREEDVVVGVEGALLYEDARRQRAVVAARAAARRREEAEEGVGDGEVVVAPRLGEFCLLAGWAAAVGLGHVFGEGEMTPLARYIGNLFGCCNSPGKHQDCSLILTE